MIVVSFVPEWMQKLVNDRAGVIVITLHVEVIEGGRTYPPVTLLHAGRSRAVRAFSIDRHIAYMIATVVIATSRIRMVPMNGSHVDSVIAHRWRRVLVHEAIWPRKSN